VKEAEMVSILGPSGSGKSTLLQIIGLLMKPDSGQIHLDGVSYQDLTEKDQATFRNKQLGFVFQFHNLLGEFSCEENIKFPLFIKGSALSASDEELFTKIIETLGIKDILKKLPSQISGGEQQRVAVARALINRPTLLLADEPTGNLDNKNAETLYALFVELKAVWQQRIIMVTHNDKLTSHSDQVIYLNSGRIE
jgi:lipoprotein-releasing system ATP-binding protein